MANPLGPYCDAAGLNAEHLLHGNIQKAKPQHLTNGLVLELYKYCGIKKLDKVHIIQWVLALLPSELQWDHSKNGMDVI